MKLKDLKPSDENIRQTSKELGCEFVDVTDLSEDEKKRIRTKNNNLFSKLLNRFGISHNRKKVKDILDDDTIPEYENAIVVGNKHINYHNKGFTGGSADKDTTDQLDVIKAFRFISQ